MKTIIKIFAAVLTAVPVLVSCYSEPLPEVIPEVIPEDEGNGSEQDTTVRVITVSFDTKATRTELSGDYFSQPVFVGGEVIMVAQKDGGASAQRCTVNVVNGVASFKTTLQGNLVAVYPADCAIFGEPDEDWESWIRDDDKVITGVMAPYKQDGTFANANICKAEIAGGQTDAVFINQTAVFVVDVPDGTKRLTVTSLGTIDDDSDKRDGNDWSTISREWSDADGGWYWAHSQIIIDNGGNELSDICFVSVMVDDEGVLLSDLNFDASFGDGTGKQGGFSPIFLQGLGLEEESVQGGSIYENVEDHLHDYVMIGDLAFSTMNLGATSVDDVGYYFAWGDMTGYKWTTDGSFENDHSFSWASCPFNGGAEDFDSKYYQDTRIKTHYLGISEDVVYNNWGGAWRMPCEGDAVEDLCVVVDENGNYSSHSKTIKFPYSGHGDGEDLKIGTDDIYKYSSGPQNTYTTDNSEAKSSYYWTSRFSQNSAWAATCFVVKRDGEFEIEYGPTMERRIGHPIRPVSDVVYNPFPQNDE